MNHETYLSAIDAHVVYPSVYNPVHELLITNQTNAISIVARFYDEPTVEGFQCQEYLTGFVKSAIDYPRFAYEEYDYFFKMHLN